ncbi:DNA mismatch repair protein MutS, partial [bacterium]|nr:DNA mismatch repair protein MutS [bacterium]
MKTEKQITPLMQQYQDIKDKYPSMLVFFQVGDFYELFFEDAKRASVYLGITLTKRGTHKGEPIPLCGVPVHTVDHYVQKLIKGGFCVVICDQLETATPGKMVKRGVTQILTPGTLTDSKMLDEKSASYLCSLVASADKWALVFAEMLTLNCYATTIPAGSLTVLTTELSRFFPD